MFDHELIVHAERLASLYLENSGTAFPYTEIRKLLQAGTKSDSLIPDLDLYLSTIVGYCSWGKRLLNWDDEKVLEAKGYVSQAFFDKHKEYRYLLPLIPQSDLAPQLETYENMRRDLLALLISLAKTR